MVKRDSDSPGPAPQCAGEEQGHSLRPQRQLQPFLLRAEQAAVAVILTVCLGLILIYLAVTHYRHGGRIDVDHAEPWQISFQVDVNTANWPELALLPNVGDQLARRIVEDREENGPFRAHDDLLRVSGIGPKTLEGIRPYLLPLDGTDTISSE